MDDLNKLKAEIEDDLRNITEFFETALKSYNISNPSNNNPGTYPVTTDPLYGRRKHFLESYMLVFPSLLWRSLDKLSRILRKIDKERHDKCFEFIEPRFEWDKRTSATKFFSYIRFFIWKICYRPNKDWHYIGPKKDEIEEIRELRNYFLHNKSKPSNGLVEKNKNKYPKNTEIILKSENVYEFIEVCKNAIDDIFRLQV
jgi:hypothetical protein